MQSELILLTNQRRNRVMYIKSLEQVCPCFVLIKLVDPLIRWSAWKGLVNVVFAPMFAPIYFWDFCLLTLLRILWLGGHMVRHRVSIIIAWLWHNMNNELSIYILLWNFIYDKKHDFVFLIFITNFNYGEMELPIHQNKLWLNLLVLCARKLRNTKDDPWRK